MEGNKVSAGLGFLPHQMRVTSKGVEFDNDWRDNLYTVEEFFRERIIIPINEFAGNNWKVQFVDMKIKSKTFIVDVIATVHENYDKIALQVIEAFPDYKFSFYNRGEMWREGRPNPSPYRTYPLN